MHFLLLRGMSAGSFSRTAASNRALCIGWYLNKLKWLLKRPKIKLAQSGIKLKDWS